MARLPSVLYQVVFRNGQPTATRWNVSGMTGRLFNTVSGLSGFHRVEATKDGLKVVFNPVLGEEAEQFMVDQDVLNPPECAEAWFSDEAEAFAAYQHFKTLR